MAPPMRKWLPDGWNYIDYEERPGSTVKCYANVLGQKFFSWKDLMHYIEYAKKEKISIYAPDFDPSNVSESNSRAAAYRKPKNGKHRSKAKKGRTNKQATTNPPIAAEQKKQTDRPAGNQCLMSPVHASSLAKGSTDPGMISLPAEGSEKRIRSKNSVLTAPEDDTLLRRASRRLAGLQPEHVPDFSTHQAASKHVFRRASRRLMGLDPEPVLDVGTNKSRPVATKRQKKGLSSGAYGLGCHEPEKSGVFHSVFTNSPEKSNSEGCLRQDLKNNSFNLRNS